MATEIKNKQLNKPSKNGLPLKRWAAFALPVMLLPGLVFAEHGRSDRTGSHYEQAKVVAAQPVYETVSYNVPLERCAEQEVAYREQPRRGSAVGPILGAIIGGAVGNAVGHKKRNKQVGTVVGAALGGAIGASASRNRRGYTDGNVSYRTEQVCNVVHETREEERLAYYDVTYQYGGTTYATRMKRDPGEYMRVRVNVRPAQ